MSLNESIVEDAALILPAATLTRPLPRGEGKELGVGIVRSEIGRVKFRKVFLTFTLHSSLSPAIPEEASACARHADRRATGKRYLQVRFERRQSP